MIKSVTGLKQRSAFSKVSNSVIEKPGYALVLFFYTAMSL